MFRAKLFLGLSFLCAVGSVTFVGGCGGGAGGTDGPYEIDNGFESDDPTGRASAEASGGADAGSASPSSSGGAESKDDANRAIEEADITKVVGNRLYALSRYGGLAIVDISNPDKMKLLGKKRTEGIPFEMYVRGNTAFVMFNDYGRWVRDASAPYGRWIQTSEIMAFDVGNPAQITEVGHFDVPGAVSDSRLVGDALYLVTYENGYCYSCHTNPATVVTSFNVASAAIAKVDQLEYSSSNRSYGGWRRSVSATNQRLYIAGPEWNWEPGSDQRSSLIQAIDITDPSGKLKKGADVRVDGQINSRWQMDEFEGVLRVVSQFNNGWAGPQGTIDPKVQTFTVTDAKTITPLGATTLKLPHPEHLRSVRFDGKRGYAITSEQTDPLFTIDLSNPAAPKQAGELMMPGFIFHMEPRGDRLIGFGYDDTRMSNARLAVSLFDVSDLTNPKMLKRVSFGSTWGHVAEDQDRIHKSVQVLDAAGLVLVPFASYGRWGGNGCEQAQSGIQLIDYSANDLVLRGLAPQFGMPRRAILAGDRLLAVSDRNVTSFDVSKRDTPVKKDELDLSNPAYRLAELPNHVASITSDWWTGEAMLSLTPKANADDAYRTGKISLASLATPSADTCTPNGWTSWYEARLFTQGNMVYVSVPAYAYGNGVRSGKLIVAAVDVSNPAAPAIVGRAESKFTDRDVSGRWWGHGGGFWDGWGYRSSYGSESSSLVASGQSLVQLGTKLAYLEIDNEPIKNIVDGREVYTSKYHRKLHVLDFANPTAPQVSAPIDLGDSRGYAPLHVWKGNVLTSRWIPSNKNPDKVRFFVDRIDLSGGAPVRLPSINTPGSLLLADEASSRFVTVDYHTTRTEGTDWSSCNTKLGDRAWFDYDYKSCVLVDRDFKLADVEGARVTLRQTMNLPSQNIEGIQIADDRVYVTRYSRYASYPTPSDPNPTPIEDGGLWAIGGIRAGQLGIVSQMVGDARWPLAASGTKIALYTEGGIAIYDTATPAPKLLAEQNLRGWGYSSHVLLGEKRAIASLGEFGLQSIAY